MTQVSDEWVKWRFRNKHEPLGNFGEKLWSRIMIGCGMFYVKLADLPAVNGKGPRLQGNDTILPDFDVSGKRRAYMDSKCKSTPVLFRKANELRHGIDKKDFEAYSTISAINRQRCILGIVEIFDCDEYEWSGALLMQTLGSLGDPIRGFSNQDHMVYWPRRKFVQVGIAEPRQLWRLANGDEQVDDRLKANVVNLFSKKEPKPIQGRFF